MEYKYIPRKNTEKTLKNAENNKLYLPIYLCNYPQIDVHDTMNSCIKFEEFLMRTSWET